MKAIPETVLAQLLALADKIDQQDATWRASSTVATPQPQLYPYQAAQLRELIETYRWTQRVVDLVSAEGSLVEPSKINRGRTVVIDGRSGLDASELTAEACFDSLFAEMDGGDSPYRLHFGLGFGGLVIAVSGGPRSAE